MLKTNWLHQEAQRSLKRLLPHLQMRLESLGKKQTSEEWKQFVHRLEQNFESLFSTLFQLYGSRYDFFYHLQTILTSALEMAMQRPKELKQLDQQREQNPQWFQSNQVVGGMCYVDLFGGNLKGIMKKIPYFKELGLTYLHLMPLFLDPEGENDGGYAVSSYREVSPHLGTIQELAELATELRKNNISLTLDFIFNHTSNEHEWAKKAAKGDPEYQEYYWIFEEDQMKEYQPHLRDIFPDRGGNFTYHEELHRWVWTTFHSYQWDLNYSNPTVFLRMMEEMFFLANLGVEILRMDAVVFVWKKPGTSCENLPEVHLILQAYKALLNVVSPAVLFKSEAIVHPDDVAEFISPQECELSYNPLLMALLWETLATRNVRLLAHSIQHRYQIDPDCSWVNYVRCHDDIGWTFDDKDAQSLGINGFDHRQFLNAFYTGRFPDTFARGLPFQEHPITKDCRISGTLASLCGLEKGVREQDEQEIEHALSRMLLLHSVIMSIGGIPLIYLGDEVALLNDYSYVNQVDKQGDNRWLHRPARDWKSEKQLLKQKKSITSRMFQGLVKLIQLRKKHAMVAGSNMKIVLLENTHVLAYHRFSTGGQLFVLANFSESPQTVSANDVRVRGLGYQLTDLITDQSIALDHDIVLNPYQFVWLAQSHDPHKRSPRAKVQSP